MQTGQYDDQAVLQKEEAAAVYDAEAVDHFVYGDDDGAELAAATFGEYWQDDRPDEEVELFEESFEDVVDDVESYLDDPADTTEGLRYAAVDEDEELAVEYEVDLDEDGQYADLTVNFMSMGAGLFGFTDVDSSSVQVNDALYKVDKESTIAHEKTHHEHPGKDELTIRYINGDLDPQNTISGARKLGGRSWAYNPSQSFDDEPY